MKIYSSNEVMEILYLTQPILKKFQQCWRPDSKYCDIEPQLVEKISSTINPKFKRFYGENWDCDDIAANGMNEVKKFWKENYPNQSEAIAFGFGMGFKWRRVEENHTANVFIFDGNAYSYDFQTEDYEKLTKRGDLIYFVYI